MSLTSLLPKPLHVDSRDENTATTATLSTLDTATAEGKAPPPPPSYGRRRRGFVPTKQADYGDGGAYPEIMSPQYPLDMGRPKSAAVAVKSSSSSTVAADGGGGGSSSGSGSGSGPLALQLAVGADGKVQYDQLLRQGSRADKIIHSTYSALLPADVSSDAERRVLPDQEAVDETTAKTKAALDRIVGATVERGRGSRVAKTSQDATYIRYTPADQSSRHAGGASQRIIRMVEAQVDPMQPPKFKTNKKVPRGPGSPPPPVMHSPPRKVSAQEQADWKIPPCISNYKNHKGFAVPLDKRKAADGRGTMDVTINDGFSKLTEALYIAEAKSREAIKLRQSVEATVAQKAKEKTEESLRQMAMRAREQRTGMQLDAGADGGSGGAVAAADGVDGGDNNGSGPTYEDAAGMRERDALRAERAQERRRERNLSRAAPGKRSHIAQERERDVSERVALGLPAAGAGAGAGTQYDSRLYNQSQGMGSGFGAEDSYSVYDKPFRGEQAASIYRPTAQSTMTADEEYEKIRSTDRFRADKGFSGTEGAGKRAEGPVQFEKASDQDLFGLDEFLASAKSSASVAAAAGGKRSADGAAAGHGGPAKRQR